MDFLKSNAIRSCYTYLIKHLDHDAVGDMLFELGLISLDGKQRAAKQCTPGDSSKCLIDLVLRSDNEEAFELFLTALDEPNPNLKKRLEQKLAEQCMIQLLSEMANTPPEDSKQPQEHDSGCVETRLSVAQEHLFDQTAESLNLDDDTTEVLKATSSGVFNILTATCIQESDDGSDVTLVKRRRRLSSLEKQQAIERISEGRMSRGLPPIKESDMNDLTGVLRSELRQSVLHLPEESDDTDDQSASNDGVRMRDSVHKRRQEQLQRSEEVYPRDKESKA